MCGHHRDSGGCEHAFARSPVKKGDPVSDGICRTYRAVSVVEEVLVAPGHDFPAAATGDWDGEAGTDFMRRTDRQFGKSCLRYEYLFA